MLPRPLDSDAEDATFAAAIPPLRARTGSRGGATTGADAGSPHGLGRAARRDR